MAISSLMCWQMVSSSSCKNQLRCCESSLTDSNSLNRWRSLTASLLSSNFPRLLYHDTRPVHECKVLEGHIQNVTHTSAGMTIGNWKVLLTLDVRTEITFQRSSTKHEKKNLITACQNAIKPHKAKCKPSSAEVVVINVTHLPLKLKHSWLAMFKGKMECF